MQVGEEFAGEDGQEVLCRPVGNVIGCGDVDKFEIPLRDMVTQPVQAHIDVLGAMLIERVLEQGNCTLVVAVQSGSFQSLIEGARKARQELSGPQQVLPRL